MQIIDLNGIWELTANRKDIKPLKAAVPGDVHKALLDAKRIPDPFFRDNELDLKWIGDTDWTYARSFKVDASLLKQRQVLLHCEGLDTLGTIRINGKQVASTDNMHRTWEFNVKPFLRLGDNTISIAFAAVVPYIGKMQQKKYLHQWGGPLEQKGRTWIRKEQCNFGWDWGPTLVTAGIWRSISILAFSDARLKDTAITQKHTRGRVSLEITAAVEMKRRAPLGVRFAVLRNNKVIVEGETDVKAGKAVKKLTVRDPELWWPAGMGKQPLYDVIIELCDNDGNLLDAETKRIGLRTLRLGRHKDKWGESFQFEANGIPFFAKGANWIPGDAIQARMTAADYNRLVEDTAAANMNMLRVWGGGIYEDEAFYDRCDELGICIWQDFMFACGVYPVFDTDFRANVKAEAEDNVKRLRHHPCIALWCGNNELEQGTLVMDKASDVSMSWKEYSKVFDKLLPQAVKKLSPETDYWPGSPHSPYGNRKDFNNPKWGDAHLWSVWHGKEPFEWYRTCEHRFNSEFGFQSFPEPRTAREYTEKADRNVTSRIMEHHQRSGIGNTTIMQYMCDWFKLPTSFDMTLWLSQILQGMAMKYACEHWRRSMPRGMGTLYWQINDCWQVASWASIDYKGRWKALHHMARDFFAPVLISGLEDADKGTIEVHVTSDQMEAFKGMAVWTITDAQGTVLETGKKAVTAAPRKNRRIITLNLKKQIEARGKRDLLVWLELKKGSKVISENVVMFARPKHLELADPKIAVQVKKGKKANSFEIILKASKAALWSWIECKTDMKLSGNFKHLQPGKPVSIIAEAGKTMTIAQVKKAITVRSLIDTHA